MLTWIIIIIICLVYLRLAANAQFIVSKFRHDNVVVYGKKRKGKDLLFQLVIYLRGKSYQSNITYGGKYIHVDIADISLSPNTYENMLHGNITKLKKQHYREKRDTYFSDTGVHLPSQYNHILNKIYPSLPLEYSLEGHLYDANIHVNYNGAFTRVWDKIREQAGEYFRPLMTVKMPLALYIHVRYYAEQQAASYNVLPFQKGLLAGSAVRAAKKQFDSTNGIVKDMWVRVPRRIIKYDTRWFEKVFFEKDDLTNKKENQKKLFLKIKKLWRYLAKIKNKKVEKTKKKD